MLLKRVSISGFKSFRKRVELPISGKTTILIGPNDHGKTNALLSIEKLNPEKAFAPGEVNDFFPDPESAAVRYFFELTDREVLVLQEVASLPSASQPQVENGAGTVRVISVDESANAGIVLPWYNKIKQKKEIELIRQKGAPLAVRLDDLPESLRPTATEKVLGLLPKAFLFLPETLRLLPDMVDSTSLLQNEVMQGVFKLSGIWDIRDRLLSGNTRKNEDELREASRRLTQRIRQNWTQGRDLEFYLSYVENNIRLTVKDTAKSVTAIAERSQGFTAYFAMRMLLVARTEEARPNGYIFMFDEPGLNLHPKGQVDLQNVFEDIAKTNQIIYSTHSVFLINKNYPERNHLIFKNEEGSNVDNKPFVGGWAKVKEHLGLYLSANFLFADKVLLAEGPTDEIHIPLILQGLIERNRFDGDLNAVAIHSGLNAGETVAAANMYVLENREVAILVDGDKEGNARKQKIEQWAARSGKKCTVLSLGDFQEQSCSIEDFLDKDSLAKAVVAACKEAIEAGIVTAKTSDWETEIQSGMSKKEGKSLGKRIEELLETHLSEAISDVWIARKYSEILQQTTSSEIDKYWSQGYLVRLAAAIWKSLDLPLRGDVTGIPLASE